MAKASSQQEAVNYDKGLIELAIGTNSEVQVVKTIQFELKGGEKIEKRILVVTSFRIFILTHNHKGPYKVDHSIHILDINAIESKKPEQVVIQCGEKHVVKFCLTKSGSCAHVIGQIIANAKINFPGGNLHESLCKDIEPSDKLDTINNVVDQLTSSETLAEAGPCGGFSRSFASICDYYSVPFLEEVAWDIDTIYLSHDSKELNIQDFDHLESRELVPLIATLEYNTWFTKLVCTSYRLTAEILDVIAKVIKRSTTIEELVLDSVSLGKEFCQRLATALTSNPKSSLERVDLSNNPSAEDRGIAHLAGGFLKLSHGLNSLNLHDTNITNKGASAIGQMLKNSKYMSTSLTRLNLSNNPLKVEGVTAICDFVAQANSLTHLDLSCTECSVEQIFGALIRGCCQNLCSLNLSGNLFSQRKNKDNNLLPSFQQFFTSTAALHEVNLSDCHLPADAARAMFLGLIENSVVNEVDVDISKNELKTAGLRAITGPLSHISSLQCLNLSDNGFESDSIALCESLCENKSVKKLYLGQNFNKVRNANNIMESLIKLISVEKSPIEFLSLADSKLKQSITLLFDSLGTNESLTELDISGNMMGDEGARVLAKALQINSKLRVIHLDRNGVTQHGLRDIACALQNNLTLQSMATPIMDVAACLKPSTEKVLQQIEKCLLRNHSPSQTATEQAYRLQQGLIMSSTQQQMVDKLIVQLQDTATLLGNSSDETVKIALKDTRRCIADADKLKQLFLKFHMSTNYKRLQEKMSSLSIEIFNFVQSQMKTNVQNILDCAESNCPFITGKEGVKDSLKISCEGKGSISKAFIDTVILQQLSPIILNEVSEKNLNLSTVVADTMMDKVIQQLEQQQAKLDLLVKGHKNVASSKPVESEDTSEIIEAAQKAKNRLSVAVNRKSRVLSEEDGEVFVAPSHPRRRPTINRRKRHPDEDSTDGRQTKKVPIIDDDFNIAVAETSELIHHTKSRARPARGRRPPTKPSQQNNVTSVESLDVGLDDFFTKTPSRPLSAVVTSNILREPEIHKSATVTSRSSKKKKTEGVEEIRREPERSKKHGLLGLGIFKKKGDKDKKSPTVPRKQDSKSKDHKQSTEDLVDGGRTSETEIASKSPKQGKEQKPEKLHDERLHGEKLHGKKVQDEKSHGEKSHDEKSHGEKSHDEKSHGEKSHGEKSHDEKSHGEKSDGEQAHGKRSQDEKPHKEKSHGERPQRPERRLTHEKEGKKTHAPNPPNSPEQKGKVVEEKDKSEKDIENIGDSEKMEEVEKEKDDEMTKTEEAEKDGEIKQEKVAQETEQKSDIGREVGSNADKIVDEVENVKRPPKFGIGLPMGAIGGDLLAEMKKRNEKSSNAKKGSPEPKPRPRVPTNPDAPKPTVAARPSSMKRSVKAKSASDLTAPVQANTGAVKRRSTEVATSGGGDDKPEAESAPDEVNGPPSKPTSPKPVLKGKPTVSARPVVPKRPLSIVKNRKSVEVKPDQTETKEVTVTQKASPEVATTEIYKKSDQGTEQQNVEVDKEVNEKDQERNVKDRAEGETDVNKNKQQEEKQVELTEVEKGDEGQETEKSEGNDSDLKETKSEAHEEEREVKESTTKEKQEEKREETGEPKKKKDEKESDREITEELGGRNNNEESSSETVVKESESVDDDVVKSAVDIATLTEAIKSSKDTTL